MSAEFWIALGVGVTASAEDLWRGTVSNWIPLTVLTGGLACQGLRGGWGGLLAGVLGAAGGFGVFLVFYLLGGMGGGDIKLMAGFGALLGFRQLLEAALWTAVCGGLLAAALILWSGWRRGCSGRVATIPYAPAISAGVWLTLLSKG